MIGTPEILILKTDGINCDEEMAHAFNTYGGHASTVHINELRDGSRSFSEFGALGIPGGFSYGDTVASGKILANEVTSYLNDQLREFVDDEKPIIGVCNGFQVLVKTGLLPERTIGEQQTTLKDNDNGRFGCQWVDLKVGESVCKFIKPEDIEEPTVPMQVAHGEGKFDASPEGLFCYTDANLIVLQYAERNGDTALGKYPTNPNGSKQDIAGLTDMSGLILGLMPHPERSVSAFHPDRPRTAQAKRAAEVIFSNIVKFAKE